MNKTLTYAFSLTVLSALMTGCMSYPVPVNIKSGNTERLQAAKAHRLAVANYEFRLRSLRDKTDSIGNILRHGWAEKELKNLSGAQTIHWNGIGVISAPDRSALAEADEALLVELVVDARKTYLQTIGNLLAISESRKDKRLLKLVRTSVEKFDPLRTYMYYLPAEIPPATFRASEQIADADRKFEEALELYKNSRSLWSSIRRRQDRQRRASLIVFKAIVADYPTSTKIGRCAFYIGECYRNYEEYRIASVWYDRAWQWDKQLPESAQYKAACLYDFDLGDREKARKYYEMVAESDPNPQNVAHAKKRLQRLKIPAKD